MMYLSGAKNPLMAADLASGAIGLLQTPNTSYALDGVAVWAMDNGCYTNAYPGDDAYLALLQRLEHHRDRCLFVAAPDHVGDAESTLVELVHMAPRIRAAGWPVALVGQDGMEKLPVPWDLTDWVFIGGSDDWKLGSGAEQFIRQAQAHGKKVHVGRVNSALRFRRFRSMGCDSADGTFIAFHPSGNLPQVRRWVGSPTQLPLESSILIDPDCRDGKCGSCIGGPCGCSCHLHDLTDGAA